MSHYQPGLDRRPNIDRRYVQISKEQQELLDRPDAWNSSQNRISNLPAQVLEQTRQFYAAKNSAVSRTRKSSPPPQFSAPGSSTGKRRRSEVEEPSASADSDSDSADSQAESQDDTQKVPWSSSPDYHKLPPRPPEPPEESPIKLKEQPNQQAFPLQRPAKLVPKAVSRTAYLAEFPSSSLESEAELEIQVPEAVTDDAEDRINIAARAVPPQPTPPSAQLPVVSSMYTAKTPVQPPSKRFKMMKPPPFEDSPPTAVKISEPSSLPPPENTAQNPSSLTDSSASTTNTVDQGQRNKGGITTPSAGDVTQSSSSIQMPIPFIRPPQQMSQESPTLSKLPPNGPPSQVPYSAFCIAYPRFRGSLDDFIRAVICVDDLRKKKALPEFLYDDFIRVFCGEYIEYISRAVEDPSNSPLTAIKWYNDNVERPIFIKGVIGKDNVENVLETYEDRTRVIRGEIGPRKSEALRMSVTEERKEPLPLASRAPIAMPRVPSWHAQHRGSGELLSDPISTADPSQPMMDDVLPQPASPPAVPARSRPGSATPATVRKAAPISDLTEDLPSPALRISQSPVPERIMQTQPEFNIDNETIHSTPISSTAISSVPETTVKPKVASRSFSSSGPELSHSMLKKLRREKKKGANEASLFDKFLSMKYSKPGSSRPGTG